MLNDSLQSLGHTGLFIGGTPMSLQYRIKLAGDQPQDLNAKTFAPNAGNFRQKNQKPEILVFLSESAQNTRSITFHVIYNRYTILDWNLKK